MQHRGTQASDVAAPDPYPGSRSRDATAGGIGAYYFGSGNETSGSWLGNKFQSFKTPNFYNKQMG
ncbi:hypothetical protein HanIR_Chr07g0321221 [Helianthus annuus]|nr:hypothetical protein HanIR_Chr07g0321221 [Helianthus annuus]